MTPQERQLIGELFQRLASLENNPRDPDAEAMIREGLRRAPNGVYSLVQSVLVQDEALKAANNRIQEYEQQSGGSQQEEQPRGFLDSMRNSIFGGGEPRGSVPRVPQGGAPAGRTDPWGQQPGYQPQQGYPQQQGFPPGYQPGAPMQPQGGGGGSFLGTAAAAAAGMIGGSLLMNGIRSAMAGHQGGPASKAFEGLGGGERPLGGSAANSDLARDAGLNDIAGGRGGSGGGTQRAGLFDDNQDDGDSGYEDSGDDGDYDDGGDSDTA
ncbi:MAG: DUF2076 domain-containing protein [Alphaproteobacteria bacterium]